MTRRSAVGDALLGTGLALTMILVLGSLLLPVLGTVAGALTVLLTLVAAPRVTGMLRVLAAVLVVIGLAALVVGLVLGSPVGAEVLGLNQTIVAMLAGVSFIRLATATAGDPAPHGSRGPGGPIRAATTVHLLGAVINLGAISFVADRMVVDGRLSKPAALLISRAFAAGAFWSPFWAASAAALSYAPRAESGVLLLCGSLVALLALGLAAAAASRSARRDPSAFGGQPAGLTALRMPIVLAVIVVVAHGLLPAIELPIVVMTASVVVSIGVLLGSGARRAMRLLSRHVVTGLASMRAELTLFTAAGILSVGLEALVHAVGFTVPFGGFGALEAWSGVILMTLAALVGVHPVISIAVLAAVLSPIAPPQTLFAMMAMIGWGTGAAVGPASGLTVFLAARYGVDNLTLSRRNLAYIALVLASALPVLWLCATIS